MTTKFFFENYNLCEADIKAAYIKNNKLVVRAILTAYLELIANGYRPELDVDHNIEFTFNIELGDKDYKNPSITDIKYENDVLYITLNGDVISITDTNLSVKELY